MAFKTIYYKNEKDGLLEESYINIHNIHNEILYMEDSELNELFVEFHIHKSEEERNNNKPDEFYDVFTFQWQFEKDYNFGNLWESLYSLSKEAVREMIQDKLDSVSIDREVIIEDIL